MAAIPGESSFDAVNTIRFWFYLQRTLLIGDSGGAASDAKQKRSQAAK